MASARAETQRRRTSNSPVRSSGSLARWLLAVGQGRGNCIACYIIVGVFPIKIHVGTAYSLARGSGNTLSRINISAPRAFTCPPLRGDSACGARRDNAADPIQGGFRRKSDNPNLERRTADNDPSRVFLRHETPRESGVPRDERTMGLAPRIFIPAEETM